MFILYCQTVKINWEFHRGLNKTHQEFSNKFTLSVVDLTHIDEATEEDRFYQIDRWAKIFRATTWEELKTLAEGDEYMAQATQELYECNADELIQQQCRAREEYYQYQRTINKALKDTTEESGLPLKKSYSQRTMNSSP